MLDPMSSTFCRSLAVELAWLLSFWWLRLQQNCPSSIISLKTPLISCHEIQAMSKMFVLCGIVMLHAVVAVRDSTWLSNSPHHSMEREQIAYEPSKREIREFQEVLQGFRRPMSATKEQARVMLQRLRNMKEFRDVKHWTETKVSGPDDLIYISARLLMPLNVTASAVSFCSELIKEAKTQHGQMWLDFLKGELDDAKDICPKVLTGSLKPTDGKAKDWEVEAAKVSQIHGEKHPFGRLDKVAWRSSLHRVCTDECNALVEGMQNQTYQLARATLEMMRGSVGAASVEEVCASTVVKKVEAEILTCCATSCGWNGRSCTYWPLMNATEQDDWQGECCTEMNILQGSTREKMCDSTLTEHETKESEQIIDNRDNTPEDRAILGQDRGGSSNAWSFLEKPPTYDADNCPEPLDLAKRHEEWATDWKRMDEYNLKGSKRSTCEREPQDTIEGCKIFLIVATNPSNNKKQKKYVYTCLDDCKFKAPDQEALKALTTESGLSSNEWVYVHSDFKWTLT